MDVHVPQSLPAEAHVCVPHDGLRSITSHDSTLVTGMHRWLEEHHRHLPSPPLQYEHARNLQS